MMSLRFNYYLIAVHLKTEWKFNKTVCSLIFFIYLYYLNTNLYCFNFAENFLSFYDSSQLSVNVLAKNRLVCARMYMRLSKLIYFSGIKNWDINCTGKAILSYKACFILLKYKCTCVLCTLCVTNNIFLFSIIEKYLMGFIQNKIS